MSWKDDLALKGQLETYVRQNFARKEILDFVNRDYSYHFNTGSCSMSTLSRIFKHFGISYIDYSVSVDSVKEAVLKELEGTGKGLGYRAMTAKLRQKYDLKVPRDVVYATMVSVDYPGLRKRALDKETRKKKRTDHFKTAGVNSFFSIDGHDKLMAYQNSTFPIAVYGMLDQASRKIVFLKCWTTNSNPDVVGAWYIEWLRESRVLPSNIRIDRGTETGKLATIHAYLRGLNGDLENPLDSVVYGPSTSNQIERWWRELHERLEKCIKVHLNKLLNDNIYNPHLKIHRDLLAFIMIPLVQKELDEFKNVVWNSHRIRKQKETLLPDGIPEHIYEFPEKYGLDQCGFEVTEEQIRDVEIQAGLVGGVEDFLSQDLRKQCLDLIPLPEEIPIKNIGTAFQLLKSNCSQI